MLGAVLVGLVRGAERKAGLTDDVDKPEEDAEDVVPEDKLARRVLERGRRRSQKLVQLAVHGPWRRCARRGQRERPRAHRRRRGRVLCVRPRPRGARHRKDDGHDERDPQREEQPEHPDMHVLLVDLLCGETVQEEDERRLAGAVRLRIHGRDEEDDAPGPLEDDLGEQREGEEEALAVLGTLDLALVAAGRDLLHGVGDHPVLVVRLVSGVEHVVGQPLSVVFLRSEPPYGEGGCDGQGADARERREAVRTQSATEHRLGTLIRRYHNCMCSTPHHHTSQYALFVFEGQSPCVPTSTPG